jgi:hypothetical protein
MKNNVKTLMNEAVNKKANAWKTYQAIAEAENKKISQLKTEVAKDILNHIPKKITPMSLAEIMRTVDDGYRKGEIRNYILNTGIKTALTWAGRRGYRSSYISSNEDTISYKMAEILRNKKMTLQSKKEVTTRTYVELLPDGSVDTKNTKTFKSYKNVYWIEEL